MVDLPYIRFERYAWIPVAITTVIAVGVSWKHLGNPPPPVPVSAPSILGFAGVQAGFLITWSGFAADYGSYLQPENSTYVINGSNLSEESAYLNSQYLL